MSDYKKSEAFKLGVLFEKISRECFTWKAAGGSLPRRDYPPEIQELADDIYNTVSFTSDEADAEKLICKKLDEEAPTEKPTGHVCKFCGRVLKAGNACFHSTLQFDAVLYGPFCKHCAGVLHEILSVETSIEGDYK